ncbi:hypothetical protein J2X72_003010 [Phyllobacterium sp. 1468]|uniref:hypothetical protein n=1 Tax=Phyllobacterium sp. 1468 TaxID=2817759 RepID=UPI002860E75F|nr:hypothetical protein [Phyllobacterium sp. 1468]MDR6634210.1 hypothetical protein [Phyllobacterium sp. 1468]
MTTKYVVTPIGIEGTRYDVADVPQVHATPGTEAMPDNPSAHIVEPHPEYGEIGGIRMEWKNPGVYYRSSSSKRVTEAQAQAVGWDVATYRHRRMIVETMRRNGTLPPA